MRRTHSANLALPGVLLAATLLLLSPGLSAFAQEAPLQQAPPTAGKSAQESSIPLGAYRPEAGRALNKKDTLLHRARSLTMEVQLFADGKLRDAYTLRLLRPHYFEKRGGNAERRIDDQNVYSYRPDTKRYFIQSLAQATKQTRFDESISLFLPPELDAFFGPVDPRRNTSGPPSTQMFQGRECLAVPTGKRATLYLSR